MKEMLIFAGTTEGRKLSERLAISGIAHTICVATEYGEIVLKEHPLAKVHRGRMTQEEIREFIWNKKFAAVVDATHPYADIITENIKTAMKEMDIPYLRLKRETGTRMEYEKSVYYKSNEDCAKALAGVEGNILLTSGSKELSKYCILENIKKRLYVRVLPGIESLTLCKEQGILGKQIIAMQGPFTTELNLAIMNQYKISCLVTKESGRSGGYQEKLEAAKKASIPLFVVGNPEKDEGYSFGEVCQELEVVCKQEIKQIDKLEIILAGVGMGSRNSLTKEVRDAIEVADILLGAERMLAQYKPRMEKRPYYQAEQIIPYLKEVQEKEFSMNTVRVVILFSGDSGFYSGCQSIYKSLLEEVEAGRLKATLRIMPGISSIAYLASCIGESYQDAVICSMHGKTLLNLIRKIQSEEKIFLLMSGVKDVNKLGKLLVQAGMYGCEIVTGYQLSYPEQQIRKLTPEECCEVKEEGLYTCFIKNPNAKCRNLTHGIADAEFIREQVPMTKEEVREISICKLQLHKNAIVYDIGSGTGSIAVETAGLSDDIQVFAIERKKEAVSLIEKNKDRFCLQNIEIIEAEAPEGFSKLPMPSHAFLGGSGGKMKEILSALYQLNPKMRIVINAISMETICEIREILNCYQIEKEEVVQLQVSRVKKTGQYHLMQAENPVWICAFNFKSETRNE